MGQENKHKESPADPQTLIEQLAALVESEFETQRICIFRCGLEQAEISNRTTMLLDKSIHISNCESAAIEILNKPISIILAKGHDIARFEQIALHGTYSDSKSGYNHAQHGADKLRRAPIHWEAFGFNGEQIADAVSWHSDYRYAGSNEYAKLVRDIDKLALLREAVSTAEKNTMQHGPHALGAISSAVKTTFLKRMPVFNKDVSSMADHMIRACGWQFDINFVETQEIIQNERLIPRILMLCATTLQEYEQLAAVSAKEVTHSAKLL